MFRSMIRQSLGRRRPPPRRRSRRACFCARTCVSFRTTDPHRLSHPLKGREATGMAVALQGRETRRRRRALTKAVLMTEPRRAMSASPEISNPLPPRGLSGAEAQARLARHGANALPEKPPRTMASRFAAQFRSPLIYILLFALAVDLAVWLAGGAKGLPLESFAILFILLLNAGLGVYQETKAEAALARLKELAESLVWVLRDGHVVRAPATQVVPGDVVRVEAGDRVP